MQIKDILVQIDTTASSDARLDLAAGLARRHGAHLIGLHVLDVPQFIGLRTGMIGPGISISLAMLVDQAREEALQATAGVEAGFRERLRREGIGGEWRFVQDWLPDTVALHARYADLAVLGQEDPHAPRMPDRSAVIEHVLFSSGRPVLIVPYAGRFETVGRRVLVGWNAGREAARAVNDALPLMAQAEAVTVLAVNPRRGVGGHGDVPAADIALHLARHGVRATAAHSVGKEISVADALLNQAAALSADLIVVGAYGHSRLRELVMGGVTRSLLNRMTCPVLMSH
jgi:nucleotide-binding universal stress UspA family protein